MTREPFIQAVIHDLAAFVWPVECLSCKRPNRLWCAACDEAFRDRCGAMEMYVTGNSHGRWWVGGSYVGQRQRLITSMKHGGLTALADPLGYALSFPLATLLHGADAPLIVPMPSRASRVRERGYRHMELILKRALPHTERLLGRSIPKWQEGLRLLEALPGRTGQVGLSAADRYLNARRIGLRRHHLRPVRLAGRHVILVDDIITTGATIEAADMLLTGFGARVIGAAAIAVSGRRDDF